MQLERKAKKMQGEADKKVCARCLVLCAVAPFCPSSPPPHACVTLHPAPLPHPPPTYPQSPALIKAREEVARLTRKVRGEERELVIRRTRAEEQAAKVAGLEVQRQQVSAAPLPHFFLSSLACSHVRARLCMHPPHARSPAHAHLYPPTLPPPPHTHKHAHSRPHMLIPIPPLTPPPPTHAHARTHISWRRLRATLLRSRPRAPPGGVGACSWRQSWWRSTSAFSRWVGVGGRVGRWVGRVSRWEDGLGVWGMGLAEGGGGPVASHSLSRARHLSLTPARTPAPARAARRRLGSARRRRRRSARRCRLTRTQRRSACLGCVLTWRT